jgi:hypothetical protein
MHGNESCGPVETRVREARDRITSAAGGEAAIGGDRLISQCWRHTNCNAGMPMDSAAPIVPEE